MDVPLSPSSPWRGVALSKTVRALVRNAMPEIAHAYTEALTDELERLDRRLGFQIENACDEAVGLQERANQDLLREVYDLRSRLGLS